MTIQRASVERGIGCAAVIPASIIGFAGLTDGIGPRGWPGFAELLGWGVVCWVSGLGLGVLLRQARRGGPRRYAAISLALAAVVAFTYFMNWLGLDAPMAAKRTFTTTLQIIGSVTPIAFVTGALVTSARQGYRR